MRRNHQNHQNHREPEPEPESESEPEVGINQIHEKGNNNKHIK